MAQIASISSSMVILVLLVRIQACCFGHWMVLKAHETEPHHSVAEDWQRCQMRSYLCRGTYI
jgi:hypothetical protein